MSARSTKSIRQACAVLGLTSIPSDQRILKKRFIELAKKYHPDAQPDSNDANKRMSEITEAYKVLRALKHSKKSEGSGASTAGDRGSWENDDFANNFAAPGISTSGRDLWLPWQKVSPSRVVDTKKIMQDAPDFMTARSKAKEIDRRGVNDFSKVASEDISKVFNGSQFSSDHFQKERNKKEAMRGQWSTSSLFFQYMKDRGLSRFLTSLRYIITGKY